MTAVVRDFTTSLTSVPYLGVKIEFSNHSDRAITVDSYQVVWPRGHVAVSDIKLRLDPQGSASRTCNLDLVILDGLTKDDFRVDVLGSR